MREALSFPRKRESIGSLEIMDARFCGHDG